MKGFKPKRIGKFANRMLGRVGIQVVRHRDSLFNVYGYFDQNGQFDYDLYRSIQVDGNKRKLDKCWVKKENIQELAEILSQRLPQINKGVCHGSRQGKEQVWFREFLGNSVEVFGTDISDTATRFPYSIQWDFHEVKPEWIGAFDFIYSNSLDHSYDPDKALNAWMSCLKPHGICILEHAQSHGVGAVNQLDPFGAQLEIMPYLVSLWGRGKFAVSELIDAPRASDGGRHDKFLLIRKFACS